MTKMTEDEKRFWRDVYIAALPVDDVVPADCADYALEAYRSRIYETCDGCAMRVDDVIACTVKDGSIKDLCYDCRCSDDFGLRPQLDHSTSTT